jgi:formylmethanofuran dehydrogenase subunit A
VTRWHIAGGEVYDPAHGINGLVRDLWIDGTRIVSPPSDPDAWTERRLDARGYSIMPGGIDMHCHIAGSKVNAGRRMLPDRLNVIPTTQATGRMLAGIGYTTAFDAAVAPLLARHTHDELRDTPNVDRGCFLLFGNNRFVLDRLAAGDRAGLDAYVADTLKSAGGYAIKIVNPGGVESYKQISRKTIQELDEPVEPYGVAPRQILRELAQCAERLGLPHSAHIHCNNLGLPGNSETTLRSMQALDGARGHFAHIQFHSYAGDRADPRSFASGTEKLFDYVMAHPEITIDVGHVSPGKTVAITGDVAFASLLRQLTGGRWYSSDTENEASCGVIPTEFKPETSLIHAVQWAIALEWYLLMLADPWRVALTSDHPNGGAMTRYPELIHLLMDAAFRNEMLSRMPKKVRQRTRLADLSAEYGLFEIAIITRAAPARILGLTTKGHLGEGADADVTVYTPSPDRTTMFARPRYVLHRGTLVLEDGEPRAASAGQTIRVEPDSDLDRRSSIDDWIREQYSVQPENYRLDEDEIGPASTVDCSH